jgi:hypothetical protein
MRHPFKLYSAILLTCLSLAITTSAHAQVATQVASTGSRAERELAQAAQQGRYVFLVFYKQQDAATDAMSKTLKQKLADKSEQARITYVQIGDPAEAALIKKYGMARAPMPLTIALAPNGAMTAIHPQRIKAETFHEAFVTRGGAKSLKAIQEQKLVFISVRDTNQASEPQALEDFGQDPHFRDRMQVVSLDVNDASERQFLDELQLGSGKAQPSALVVLAPPGVLVGKFPASTSKDDIAAAIAKANKCCDDPNCKHRK